MAERIRSGEPSGDLALRGVAHRLGTKQVLCGVDLTVHAGEVVALLGPNGSGKSTLLRAGSRALRPDSGAVLLDGVALAQRSAAELARELTALEQEPRAGFDFTVGEVVGFGRLPHLGRFAEPGERDHLAVARALEITDIVHLEARAISSLSSGERQRAWLAMALAQEPRVLLLDEPTAYLDLAHQLATMEIIVRRAAAGLAVLFATHDLSLAVAYAQRLLLLADGRVVADGTPREVVTEANIERAYGARVRLLRDDEGVPIAVVPQHVRNPSRAW